MWFHRLPSLQRMARCTRWLPPLGFSLSSRCHHRRLSTSILLWDGFGRCSFSWSTNSCMTRTSTTINGGLMQASTDSWLSSGSLWLQLPAVRVPEERTLSHQLSAPLAHTYYSTYSASGTHTTQSFIPGMRMALFTRKCSLTTDGMFTQRSSLLSQEPQSILSLLTKWWIQSTNTGRYSDSSKIQFPTWGLQKMKLLGVIQSWKRKMMASLLTALLSPLIAMSLTFDYEF